MTRQAQRVTTTVPIVMFSRAPVEEGLVASLARPAGTSGAGEQHRPGLAGQAARVAPRGHPQTPAGSVSRSQSGVGRARGHERPCRSTGAATGSCSWPNPAPTTIRAPSTSLPGSVPISIIISQDAIHYPHRRLIAEFAARNRLPSMSSYREYVEAGGLMSYGHDSRDIYRRIVIYVDNILRAQACRPPGPAADQVRAGHQSQDREGSRSENDRVAARLAQTGHSNELADLMGRRTWHWSGRLASVARRSSTAGVRQARVPSPPRSVIC